MIEIEQSQCLVTSNSLLNPKIFAIGSLDSVAPDTYY